MDEPKPTPLAESTQSGPTADPVQASPAQEVSIARGSEHAIEVPPAPRERTEHSVMEGLPKDKAERVAAMRRELAELQRQLIEAQQRIATELQGRADDADRIEALEARLQAHELDLTQNATRTAELDTELSTLRSQLASATEHLETTRAELATMTTERDTVQANRSRLERELEDQLEKHRAVTDQVELQLTSARDANALVATRDAELAAMTTERDSLKTDLEQARRDLDASRTKVRDVASQIARFGQDLVDDVGVAKAASASQPAIAIPRTVTDRQQPPPLPPPRAAGAIKPEHVDMILEVTEEPKPASRLRSGLLLLGGVIAGCAVTIAIMKGNSSSSAAAGDRQEPSAPPPAALVAPLATEPAPAPVMPVEPSPEPSTLPGQPTPAANAGAANQSAVPPAPAAITTDGAIVLPPEAAGHRVYVDGKVVDVTDSRAVVPCGAREVRIGSRGAAVKVDVACGGETAVPSEPRDH